MSARLLWVLTSAIFWNLKLTRSQRKWCAIPICFVLAWNLGLWAIVILIVAWLSEKIVEVHGRSVSSSLNLVCALHGSTRLIPFNFLMCIGFDSFWVSMYCTILNCSAIMDHIWFFFLLNFLHFLRFLKFYKKSYWPNNLKWHNTQTPTHSQRGLSTS